MSIAVICDRCGCRLQSGWQLGSPLRQIDAKGVLTVVIDRPGDYCSSCMVGIMVTHKMEHSSPDMPVLQEEEISLDDAVQERLAEHAPRPSHTPPAIPPATTISKRKREGLL